MINETYFNDIYLNKFLKDEHFNKKLTQNKKILSGFKLKRKHNALDLGAGAGVYSIALAEIGFTNVTSIDYSSKLLDLLEERNISKYNITTIVADLHNLEQLNLKNYDFINFTGDTILYLKNKIAIKECLKSIYKIMHSNSIFHLQFRDFSKKVDILERYTLTQQDENYSQIISLNYEDEFIYTVDLISKKIENNWILEKGINKKIRISMEEMMNFLKDIGYFIIKNDIADGNVQILCNKGN